MHPSFLQTARLLVLLFSLTLLSACSKSEQVEDLAVAKMPVDQMQATNFLPLNADKPGTPVQWQRYLVPGKYTIVEFFSPYDQTCVDLEPRLVQLSQVRNDLAVRTVNINRPEAQGIDWQSPIANELQLQTLPYFQVFDPAGNLRAQGRPAYEQIQQWVR